MSDKGSESPKKTNDLLNKPVSRRGFIRGGVKIGGAIAGGWILGKASEDPRVLAKPEILLAEYLDRFNLNDNNANPQKVEIEPLKDPLYGEVISVMFPNTPLEQMPRLIDKINTQRNVMLGALSVQDYESLTRIDPVTHKSINDEITEACEASGVPYAVLLGMVITESKANKMAVPQEDIEALKKDPNTEMHKGLTQMSDTIALKYGLKISQGDDDERFVPSKILRATAEELKESFEQFNGKGGGNNDWGYPVWEWHAGRGEIYLVLQKYLEDMGIVKLDVPQNVKPLADTVNARETATAVARSLVLGYQRVIKEKKISVFALLEDQNVSKMVEGPGWDFTTIYDFRVAASSILWSQINQLKMLGSKG